MEKISHQRRVYDSVDDIGVYLMLIISQKSTESKIHSAKG